MRGRHSKRIAVERVSRPPHSHDRRSPVVRGKPSVIHVDEIRRPVHSVQATSEIATASSSQVNFLTVKSHVQACQNLSPLNRRRLLQVGGAGLFGLTLPRILRAAPLRKVKARAKSVIFLFQWGGPSHLETFDMKPDAPSGIRGFHKPISSNVPGIQVSEHLPHVAKVMDKVTLIRSVHHTMNNHNSAGYYALTGHAPPSDDQRLTDSMDLFPGYPAVVDKVAPLNGNIPTAVSYPYRVADGSTTPGQHASFLGKKHDPMRIFEEPHEKDFHLPELSLPSNLSSERLQSRRELQKLVDSQARLLDRSAEVRGFDSFYDTALGMLNSTELRKAFDLSREKQVMRDAYGMTPYGQSCLLARRLVETGVKFVSVYFSNSIGGRRTDSGGWDTHGFDNTRMFPIMEKRHLPITNQTLPTLLNDLEQRGLLDETLVVWFGEFGRTPRVNKSKSRDHWPRCYTVLLAGGGVKRGHVYGASDKEGAYPEENAVKPDDVSATMYHLLGIDPATEVHDVANRPLPISYGKVIHDVIA
ncbi:MAG: hypothetical protein CMO80_18100 [Verrucomicrobiales bacterium]|nr:hypothetical protein [Verrucomicrobiales bacterium]